MTREDLEELHALAASISAEHRGWRAHRRARADEAARRRAEAEALAPIKRRRRHRWVAFVAVALIAAVGGVLIVMHLPGKPAPKPKRTVVHVHHLPSSTRVGQYAATRLAQQGVPPNVFACQGLYESEQMATVPGQQGAQWRADYLQACLNSSQSAALR
ncbi:MAG: hypothetical protein JO246_14665 [Frankiaceae bacterium]|nr:hypothetical protein [Frankiaceae bacterium]MBV9872187.1 hypothetical protein [Frankiaceae bacterium]